MTKVGMRKIYFRVSMKHHDRCVMEISDGADGEMLCVWWYGNLIEVEQVNGDKNATAGWQTVDMY